MPSPRCWGRRDRGSPGEKTRERIDPRGNEQGFEHSCASCEGNPNPADWHRAAHDWEFSQHNGTVIEGVPYNRLMVTILQAFGLEPSDYEREACQGYGETRTLGKPADAFAVDYDFSKIGDVLPGIVA